MVCDRGRLHGPQREVEHRSDCTKKARQEKEKLEEDEMEADVDAPQGESAEIESPKKEGDSGRIRRIPRLRL